MLEITVLVSSPLQAEDVVNCGADAVLLRFDSSAQRSGGERFNRNELAATVRFCHVSGAKVYVLLDKELTDSSEDALRADIEAACECGVDALRVNDAGLACMVHMLCPKMSLQAGSGLAAHSLYGAAALLGLGFERISCAFDSEAFSAFLDQKKFTPELTVLSPGCSALSGRCYIASLRNKKSERCGFACREPFGYGRQGFYSPLCANPVCMIKTVARYSASNAGVLLDITGMRADLAHSAIRAFCNAAKGKGADERMISFCAVAFGQTSAFEPLNEDSSFFANTPPAAIAAPSDIKRPSPQSRVEIAFVLTASAGKPLSLICADKDDNQVSVEGKPCLTGEGPSGEAKLRTELYRRTHPPFQTAAVRLNIQKGVLVSLEELVALKERAMLQLIALRGRTAVCQVQYVPSLLTDKGERPSGKPDIAIELSKKSQLSSELAFLSPKRLYLPLAELVISERELFLFRQQGTLIGAVLPQKLTAQNQDEVKAQLHMAKEMGASLALAPGLDSAALAINEGFDVMADWGMNIKSSLALSSLAALGIKSAHISFELEYEEIEKLSPLIPLEMTVYGRLPLAVTAHNLQSEQTMGISDRKHGFHPLIQENLSSILCHSEVLYIDKAEKYASCPVSSVRLRFTGENERECAKAVGDFMRSRLKRPNACTGGLYEKDKFSILKEKLRRSIKK
ncbi:MAG: U32 family peptidase [Oscillospiraceae bacterium]|nr:U32 family peptidase [Oscillospiraceae bacterium]